LMATVAGVDSFQSGSNPHSIALPITTQASDLIIAAFQGGGTITAATGWENLSGAAGFDPLRTLSTSKLWGLKRVASGAETSIDFTATGFYSFYAAAVLRGEGLDVSGVNHAMYQNVDAGDPNSVTGSSPGTGTQLLFGLAEVFGIN